MKKNTGILIFIILLLAATGGFFLYRHFPSNSSTSQHSVLAFVPSGTARVLYVDLAALRSSPFLAQLYAWAPKPSQNSDYAQFVQNTGFDYERDLNRVAIFWTSPADNSSVLAIADGTFDRSKISAYAAKSGARETHDGHEEFAIPLEGGSRKLFFRFLTDHRIALATDATALSTISESADWATHQWQQRFDRLAGSPVFAVLRQDAGFGRELALQAPGGLQSPQLAGLLNQLSWITVAGQPSGENLRVVAEGEAVNDTVARQLSDMLNGVLMLAQAGLNQPSLQKQLGTKARDSYLETLQDAQIFRLDRGETKAVRLIFTVTPDVLQLAPSSAPSPANPASNTNAGPLPQSKAPAKHAHSAH